jgi:hypothetical protein
MNDQQKLIAGVVLIGVGIVIAVAFLANSNSDDNSPSGSSGNGGSATPGLACTLTASGVGLVAAGLSQGKSAGAIVATVGGPPVVGFACNEAIKAMVNKPREPVELTIEPTSGPTIQELITGSQLAKPPPQVQSTNTCFDWDSLFLFRLCLNGSIGPPTAEQ